ncbi:unnamed protein product [Gadus morhua 'NCC']
MGARALGTMGARALGKQRRSRGPGGRGLPRDQGKALHAAPELTQLLQHSIHGDGGEAGEPLLLMGDDKMGAPSQLRSACPSVSDT